MNESTRPIEAGEARSPEQLAVALRAIQLLGKWTRAARGHVPLNGYACACSLGVGSISVLDFEQDLIDYLYGKHGNALDIKSWFENAGYRESNPSGGTLSSLLQALAHSQLDAHRVTLVTPVLNDLEKTMDSFSAAHAPGSVA